MHQPWQAPTDILTRARVGLDLTYPRPIVSHAIARVVALEAFSKGKIRNLTNEVLPRSKVPG
jgi:deoxyribodipyrimidine photo-lyase